MTGWRPCIWVVLLLVWFGCSTPPSGEEQHIRDVITTRAAALNSRNMAHYMAVISADYNDKGKNRSQLQAAIEKNFHDYEQITFVVEQQNITITGNSAAAQCAYRMKIRIHGKDVTMNGREQLTLTKESTGWKIIAGI